MSWEHKIAGPSLNEYLWPGSTGNGYDWSLVEGATDIPYKIPHIRVENVKKLSKVPLGLWRSVGHAHNAFVKESFIDELAVHTGTDPVEYRDRLLVDAPAYRDVLHLAAEKSGWGGAIAEGRFRGVAIHRSFSSYVAQVAEISIDVSGKPVVHRVVCAIDCGTVVNPDGVRAQLEGAIIFGLGAALKSEITIRKGRVEQTNYLDYPILTLSETPEIETYFINSKAAPTGVGEPGVPPIAPAVTNAMFAALGTRIRSLPIKI